MNRRALLCVALSVAGLAVLLAERPAGAAITPEQRRELGQINRVLSQAASRLRVQRYEEAAELLDDAETRLRAVISEAMLAENDPAVARHLLRLQTLRANLAERQGGDPADPDGGRDGVSFVRDVAPIFAQRCMGCHGTDNPRGQFSLATYNNLGRGGSRGPAIVPGNAMGSRLVAMISGRAQPTMPRQGEPLSAEQIATIAQWINEGARFDGDDPTVALNQLSADEPGATPEPRPGPANVTINRPRGDETVSFLEDVAPVFANICSACHNDNQRRGGLSMGTFVSLMQGGDSGPVIVPGDPDRSRLVLLITGRETPRMPQGQRRITEEMTQNIITWVREGASFDGQDPAVALRELVPTPEELRERELAAMSHGELAALRLDLARQFWRTANPNRPATAVERDEFLVYGNVAEGRLEEIAQMAERNYELLESTFGLEQEHLWPGKLTIFVCADRFDYQEFGRMVERRELPRGYEGHWRAEGLENLYVVLEDSQSEPGTEARLAEVMTGALLEAISEQLPEWVVQGTATAVAARVGSESEYFVNLRRAAREALLSSQNWEGFFDGQGFSPEEHAAVSFAVCEYIMESAGRRYPAFLSALGAGGDIDQALAAFGATRQSLLAGTARDLARVR